VTPDRYTLDRLADDLLDFAEPADLQRWFTRYTTQ
jgi:hypothetical protein